MHIGPQQNSLQTRLDRVQYWAKSLQIIVCFTSLTLLFGLWEGHLAHKKSVPLVLCDSVPEQLQKQNWGSGLAGKWPLLLLLFFTLGIKDPKGFGKKTNTSNRRSDDYSRHSSRTNESQSRMLLYCCNKTQMHWIKKAVSHLSPERWLILCTKTLRKWQADSLIGPRISTTIG